MKIQSLCGLCGAAHEEAAFFACIPCQSDRLRPLLLCPIQFLLRQKVAGME